MEPKLFKIIKFMLSRTKTQIKPVKWRKVIN